MVRRYLGEKLIGPGVWNGSERPGDDEVGRRIRAGEGLPMEPGSRNVSGPSGPQVAARSGHSGAVQMDRVSVSKVLAGAGCIAAFEEADELLRFANGDAELLHTLVSRRTEGEPIAWLTGAVTFCGMRLFVDRVSTCPAYRPSRWRDGGRRFSRRKGRP